MSCIDQCCQQYRTLRLTSVANNLPELVEKAEKEQVSYLKFATLLAEYEQEKRTERRIMINRKKAAFPMSKSLA